jgi:hypothetical protein
MYFIPQNLGYQIIEIHYLKLYSNPVEAAQNITSFNYLNWDVLESQVTFYGPLIFTTVFIRNY